jgi:arylsulfatase A-like enzyme
MSQPNILFILIDDLGARDLGCYGSTFYETPHLDRLAADGLRCERAYASCTVCSPTRASIMSGKYPARVGITQFIGGKNSGRLSDVPYLHYLPLSETSLATALSEGGYQTWHLGKWHLGDEAFHPDRHGFDVNIGGCHWGHPYDGFQAPWGIPTLDEQPEGTWLTRHLTDRAIDLIRQRDSERPFFMHLSHYAVHTPIQAPPELVEKYRAKARALGLDQIDPMSECGTIPFGDRYGKTMRRRVLQSHPVYAAMIEEMDTEIGRLLQALDDAGLSHDTLVVFTSDNGGECSSGGGAPTCNLPLAEGKGWAREGGTRVCQMLRWPGQIAPGSSSSTPMISCDFYPSLLHAAELPQRPEQHVDGVDLCSHWQQGTAVERDALFWHYPHYSNQGDTPHASMLSGCGRWKFIWHFEDDVLRLFDLHADPSESRDCAAEHQERVRAMHQRLQAWQEDVCARMPEPNPVWHPRPQVPNNAHE